METSNNTKKNVVIKTDDLSGTALDWAVAQIAGIKVVSWSGALPVEKAVCVFPFAAPQYPIFYQPSQDGKIAMGLIKLHNINLHQNGGPFNRSSWFGTIYRSEAGDLLRDTAVADDPIVAAMRCLVLNKIGSMVNVPVEFAGGVTNE